jgi:hypothetical protein
MKIEKTIPNAIFMDGEWKTDVVYALEEGT